MGDKTFSDRLKHAWNVFKDVDDDPLGYPTYPGIPVNIGMSSTTRLDRTRLRPTNERSIVSSLYNQIANDVAAIPIRHVRVDKNDVFVENISSSINECLTIEANIDQTGREFIFDAVMSMFDEGVVALVPIETKDDLLVNNTIDILSIRTAKIIQWYPRMVTCEVYNDKTGNKQNVTLPKDKVAIVENPFYSVMNEPNSTLKRLIHKLNLLDAIDDQSGASKLDLIVQLPYVVKSETRMEKAEERRKMLEDQLANSKYGVGYIDATERITQLNRPVENNLMSQIEYLTNILYSQMGISKEVFEGTANPTVMLNYYNKTVEPILAALTMEMKRKFLTKTARTQGQTFKYYQNPFKLVPVSDLADLADKFTRNEILSSNEFRSVIGYEPVDDPRADELRNKNLNVSDEQLMNPILTRGSSDYEDDSYEYDDNYY